MFAFLKPLLCLPLLLALTAPRSTLVAGLLVVPAVAFATGDWVSLPASGLIAAGVVLAATSTAWHFWRWKWSPVAIGAGVTALAVTALVLVRDWHVDVQEGWRRAVAAALLSALSTGASLWWLAGPRRGRGWRAVILGVLLLCSGVLVFGLVFNPLSGHVIFSAHLVGFLVVYLTVLGSTVGLTCFFPPPLRVDLDDTGELVAASWTATSTAGSS